MSVLQLYTKVLKSVRIEVSDEISKVTEELAGSYFLDGLKPAQKVTALALALLIICAGKEQELVGEEQELVGGGGKNIKAA